MEFDMSGARPARWMWSNLLVLFHFLLPSSGVKAARERALQLCECLKQFTLRPGDSHVVGLKINPGLSCLRGFGSGKANDASEIYDKIEQGAMIHTIVNTIAYVKYLILGYPLSFVINEIGPTGWADLTRFFRSLVPEYYLCPSFCILPDFGEEVEQLQFGDPVPRPGHFEVERALEFGFFHPYVSVYPSYASAFYVWASQTLKGDEPGRKHHIYTVDHFSSKEEVSHDDEKMLQLRAYSFFMRQFGIRILRPNLRFRAKRFTKECFESTFGVISEVISLVYDFHHRNVPVIDVLTYVEWKSVNYFFCEYLIALIDAAVVAIDEGQPFQQIDPYILGLTNLLDELEILVTAPRSVRRFFAVQAALEADKGEVNGPFSRFIASIRLDHEGRLDYGDDVLVEKPNKNAFVCLKQFVVNCQFFNLAPSRKLFYNFLHFSVQSQSDRLVDRTLTNCERNY